MPSGSGRFLRENAFLVAAISLPLVIVALFLLLSAIPRWTVPPPSYDVLLRTIAYDRVGLGGTAVEFVVKNERLHVTVREAPVDAIAYRPLLWLFDHRTMSVSQVPVQFPELAPGEKGRTVPIEALAGRRVVTQSKAPDGYEYEARNQGGGGLIGDIFGMRRDRTAVALINRGRIVKLSLATYNAYDPPMFVGWVIDEGTH